MQVGIQFFPDIGPDVKSARDYWQEALSLVALCDRYGYSHVRTVEHYFHPYGGYSPNPVVFLAAAAQVTKRARLVTGAVLPAFNNPLKLAGELAMLDALCDGRLDIGFARAFLPHEFARFGVRLDESRARFDEGMEQVRLLLEQENVTCEGRFHSFAQRHLAAAADPEAASAVLCRRTGNEGVVRARRCGGSRHHGDPDGGRCDGGVARPLPRGMARAGHPGRGTVMLAFHMFCHEDQAQAEQIAREPLNRYLRSLVAAASDWMAGEALPTIQATTRSLPRCRGTRSNAGREMRRLGRHAATDSRHGRSLSPADRRFRDRLAAGELQRHRARRCAGVDAAVRRGSAAAIAAAVTASRGFRVRQISCDVTLPGLTPKRGRKPDRTRRGC